MMKLEYARHMTKRIQRRDFILETTQGDDDEICNHTLAHIVGHKQKSSKIGSIKQHFINYLFLTADARDGCPQLLDSPRIRFALADCL